MTDRFKGSCVALVTPFKNGSVDEKRFRELIDFQVAGKTQALVPCGSTGESATLSYKEHERVVELTVRQARGRIPVIAGTGSNSTAETITLTRHAKSVGADAALLITPYYNKPSQRGLIEHFSAVAKNVPLPLILYNIPGRTGVNMLPQTFLELVRRHKNIIGIKESSGNLDQVTEISAATRGRKDFTILSGDDSLTLPILAAGGQGVISVLANIAPGEVNGLCQAFAQGNIRRAQELHWKMFPLIKALFVEVNPVPIKAAMEILGMCQGELRLPLCALTAENRAKLALELKRYGLKKRGR